MSAKTLGDELHEEQAQAAYEREMKRRKPATLSALDALLKELDDHYNDPLGMVTAARAELAALRATVAQLSVERDAFAAENDAIHRAVNEMCGTDTSTIEAVQHVIEQRNKQAQKLEQAQEIIKRQYTGNYRTYTERRDAMRAWLDANTPQG